ncbi:MAG: methyltransferase domain-containing protein [Nitrospinota bacterium]|nr:MAG: methyltransferase domain-containing protein [Nitrospinota bacterium]
MPHNRDQPLFGFADPDDFRRLQELLLQNNYTETAIQEVLAATELTTPRPIDLPPLLYRTRHGTPLETLIRLFLLGVPVGIDTVRRTIHPMTLEQWVAAGLLAVHGDQAIPLVELRPYQGLVLASDPPYTLQREAQPHFVMGVGSSTRTLANLTIRRPSRCSLDLGTGCGIHALLAAPHSEQVYAVDPNPRALRFTEFNAQLNGLSNITCLPGDLFAPVRTAQFDLVVSNPPYVISPAARYLYRDSTMPSDHFCQRIAREVTPLLTEGGYCQFLCHWIHPAGQDWRERLAGWFAETGCDTWVLRSATWDPSPYAIAWIHETEEPHPDRVAALYEEWMAYYAQEGIEAIGMGLVTMRRSSRKTPWFHLAEAPEKMFGPCGEFVLQQFALHDFLEALPDDQALLDLCLSVSPDVRWEQQCTPAETQWQVDASYLRLSRGFAYAGTIDPYIAGLVIRCNGQRPLRTLLNHLAASLHVDLGTITPACLAVVRRLIEQGFLLPPGVAPIPPP